MQMDIVINSIEEESEQLDAGYPNKTVVACMVNGEICVFVAVMRRNVRWAVLYKTDDDELEHPLVQSLKALSSKIFLWKIQWHPINPALYPRPFLEVIKSRDTGAPVTDVALSSVYKILILNIIDQNTINVGDGMYLVFDVVTSCKFEMTDARSEELVLMKIFQVLFACVKSKATMMLSNQHIIVDTCLDIIRQAGTKSELLQCMAHYTMHELVRCVYSHLQDVDNTDNALVNGSTTLKQKV